MQNKQFIAVAAGVVAAFFMWGASEKLPANFSSFFPLSSIESLSAISLKENSLSSRDAIQAWAVFEQYLEYAKNHDIEGVMSISHQRSVTCSDPNRQAECIALLDTGYLRGSSLNKENFVNAWSDNKQIILSTGYTTVDLSSFDARGHIRSIIYFSRDENGTPKLIGFNPNDSLFLVKNGRSDEAVDKELEESLLDSDKDSLSDIRELCQTPNGVVVLECVATDPHDPDTNGDGWWDGIEALFR